MGRADVRSFTGGTGSTHARAQGRPATFTMPTEDPSLLAAAAARSAARRAAAGPAWRTASSSTLFFLPLRATPCGSGSAARILDLTLSRSATPSNSTLLFLPVARRAAGLPPCLTFPNPTLHLASAATHRSWFHPVHTPCGCSGLSAAWRLQATCSRAPAPTSGTTARARPVPCQHQGPAARGLALQLLPPFAANTHTRAG